MRPLGNVLMPMVLLLAVGCSSSQPDSDSKLRSSVGDFCLGLRPILEQELEWLEGGGRGEDLRTRPRVMVGELLRGSFLLCTRSDELEAFSKRFRDFRDALGDYIDADMAGDKARLAASYRKIIELTREMEKLHGGPP